MLVLHPSSTCDICFEGYTWATPANAPHAIACGHIFCLECLRLTHPSACPLCRKGFMADRIKKLHVDRYAPAVHETHPSFANELLQRMAMVSGENTPEDDVMSVIAEVQQWLNAQEDRSPDVSDYKPLRNAVAALHRYTVVRREIQDTREVLANQTQDFSRRLHIKELDIKTSRTVEENLLSRIQALEKESSAKISHAEKSLADAETELMRLRAEHAQFRTELAKYHHTSNPLPPPPQFMAKDYFNSIPRPVTSLSHHSKSALTGSPANNLAASKDTSHSPSAPFPIVNDLSPYSEDAGPTNETVPKRPLVMKPGAAQSAKVVPPRPVAGPDRRKKVWRLTEPILVPNASTAASAPAVEHHAPEPGPSARPDPSMSNGISGTFSLSYAFVPGVGYVSQPQQSLPSRSTEGSIKDTTTYSAGGVGGLLLYSGGSLSSLVQNAPTVESAARALGIASGEIETVETSWGHVRDALATPLARNGPSTSIATGATSRAFSTSNQRPRTASVSGRQNNNHAVPNAAQPVLPTAPRGAASRQSLNSRGDTPVQAPSPALTWGSVPVPSGHSSRSASLSDLHLTGLPVAPLDTVSDLEDSAEQSPNIDNLGLTGLPGVTVGVLSSSMNNGMSELRMTGLPRGLVANTSRIQSRASSTSDLPATALPGGARGSQQPRSCAPGHSPPADNANDVLTPRGRPLSYEPANEAPSYHSNASRSHGGLGLNFDAGGSSDTARAIINGQDDLRFVNQSLMQFVNEDQREARRPRHTRHASMSDAEDTSAHPTGVRSSMAMYHARHDLREANDPAPVVPSAAGADAHQASSMHRYYGNGTIDSQGFSSDSESMRVSRIRQRRHSSMTVASASSDSQSELAQAPAARFTSDTHRRSGDTASIASSRSRTRGQCPPVIEHQVVPAEAYPPAVGNGSLGLSFAPASTSAATTSTGEPSSIHAPRPLNGRHSNNLFGLWNSRSARE